MSPAIELCIGYATIWAILACNGCTKLMIEIGAKLKTGLKRLRGFLGGIFSIGCGSHQSDANNRITTFTNAIGYFAALTCLSVFSQLENFGVPKLLAQTFFIYTVCAIST